MLYQGILVVSLASVDVEIYFLLRDHLVCNITNMMFAPPPPYVVVKWWPCDQNTSYVYVCQLAR